MNIKAYIEEKKGMIEGWLEQYVPASDSPPLPVYQAMRYSLMAKSKRIRPVLTLAATELLGGKIEWAMPFACALELIHTYSLIHDDLPAMDNDDFRRGQPSNHKVFGEGMAILAGDALLSHAFFLMSSPQTISLIPASVVLQAMYEIARAAGTYGMIGGQVMDLTSEGQSVSLPHLETMHLCKTGAMILAAIRVGGIVGIASDKEMESLSVYGQNIGLAFQIIDDVLDVEGKPELLGKTIGKDGSARKATFPLILGLEESKTRAHDHYLKANQAIDVFGDRAKVLRGLAHLIVFRDY